LHWRSGEPTRILILPRHPGGEPVWIETDPFYQFHFGNGFQDRGTLVIDFVRYSDYSTIGEAVRQYWQWPWPTAGMGRLARMRVEVGPKRVSTEYLSGGLAPEFPQFALEQAGRDYRYLYSVAVPAGRENGFWQVITKTDLQSGLATWHDFSPNGWVGEPIFVARPGARHEDDGYLLTMVFDSSTGRSYVAVLDARDLTAKPLAIVHLRHHVPYGFHGCFRA
jgi:all-trans-8'-apo-beta-carotenal 15,15'-oxygenase